MPEARRAASVAGVVLAAGASMRMGRNKLLLELEGSTLLRRAARRAVAAGLAPVVVVLGHEAERVRRELDGLPVRVEVNPSYRQGMSASLRTGIAALPPDVGAVVVTLADMPFVTVDMLAALVERYREGAAPLVVSDYAGVNAPPTLYDQSLFPELLSAAGDTAGREVVGRHRGEADTARWPASALLDLDVPDDYDRARARFRP